MRVFFCNYYRYFLIDLNVNQIKRKWEPNLCRTNDNSVDSLKVEIQIVFSCLLNKFPRKTQLTKTFIFNYSKHVMALLKVIIKCADVSNEVRPENVAGPWVKCLFEEYSQQCAREKLEHLPVASYMDPELVGLSHFYNFQSFTYAASPFLLL